MSRNKLNTANLPQLRCLVCSATNKPFSKDCQCGALICIICRGVFDLYCYACGTEYQTGPPSKPKVNVKLLKSFIDNFFEDFDPLA